MLETSFRVYEETRTLILIGCPPMAERQKCYGTAVTAQGQLATATAQRNFSRKQLNSFLRRLGLRIILTEFT